MTAYAADHFDQILQFCHPQPQVRGRIHDYNRGEPFHPFPGKFRRTALRQLHPPASCPTFLDLYNFPVQPMLRVRHPHVSHSL
jgi:hypothetical protein